MGWPNAVSHKPTWNMYVLINRVTNTRPGLSHAHAPRGYIRSIHAALHEARAMQSWCIKPYLTTYSLTTSLLTPLLLPPHTDKWQSTSRSFWTILSSQHVAPVSVMPTRESCWEQTHSIILLNIFISTTTTKKLSQKELRFLWCRFLMTMRYYWRMTTTLQLSMYQVH